MNADTPRGIRFSGEEWNALSQDAESAGVSTGTIIRLVLHEASRRGILGGMLKNLAVVTRAEETIDLTYARRALLNRAEAILRDAQPSSRNLHPIPVEEVLRALRACADIARAKKWAREHKILLKMCRDSRPGGEKPIPKSSGEYYSRKWRDFSASRGLNAQVGRWRKEKPG